MVKTILVFLVIFSIIVVIHEFGHFYWAKKAGILVREFSLGMGPKLFAKQAKDGTTYTVRMLPLGGYVRLAGLGEEEMIQPGQSVGIILNEQDKVVKVNTSEKQAQLEELPIQIDHVDLVDEMKISGYVTGQDERKDFEVDRQAEIIEPDGTIVRVAPKESRYESVSVFNKILTNFGGPLNNFILSILAFTIVGFMLPNVPNYSNEIGEVIENSSAEEAGLLAGDRILSIEGISTKNWNELTAEIAKYPDKSVEIEVERDNKQMTVPAKVSSSEMENGQKVASLGITIKKSTAVLDRILFGFTATWNVVMMVLGALSTIFTRGFDLNMFGGPVAMAQATSQVANEQLVDIIWFLASLSTNLGIINLLPIPALDGGKIVMNLVELLRGKPLSQEKEGLITLVGVVLLLVLMVAVTWNDIMRAFF
ncbi:RIP metalloprotease RseP [Facklamia sp. DSM 111018]|uniref:Zinc metalloprotease n=1 Tax=Facklamia lactis TaxID=2749967 RepID=A0ABS0LPQ6_9LACT|nr:RIP metalloprotease RseP [Facklamia lactis]MBG9985294.1 RIP metalloprotease RseP [Facklamia lactis]